MIDTLVAQLVRVWVRLYLIKPRETIAATVLLIAAMVTGVVLGVRADRKKADAERSYVSYQEQSAELARVEASLRNMSTFVAEQRRKLKESEDVIAALRHEHAKLRPVVEADRRAIEAVFQLQEERTRQSVWRERWIGSVLA